MKINLIVVVLLFTFFIVQKIVFAEKRVESNNYRVIQHHYKSKSLAALSPDVRWTLMEGFPNSGTFVGPDEVVEKVFKRLKKDWSSYTLKINKIIDGGDVIVGLGNYSGTHRATGKSFTAAVAHVWTLRGGKIISLVQYTDTLKIIEATR